MKLVAGLGSIDDYFDFVNAGADELFCGYVPEEWMREGGLMTPLNRREVLFYNVQIGSKSELEILRDMVKVGKVPVTIALNALYYRPELYERIASVVAACAELSFTSFILADPALLLWLRKDRRLDGCSFHISGELGEINQYTVSMLKRQGANRIIFPRKTTIAAMEACQRENRGSIEYEAFLLNEMCEFSGCYCHTFHCDELAHMCLVPYRMAMEKEHGLSSTEQLEEKDIMAGNCADKPGVEEIEDENMDVDGDILGAGGCGLCALWKLSRAGVQYVKVVGRGNSTECMIRDIRAVKQAISILEKSVKEEEYVQEMKRILYPAGCSGHCYYLYNQ